MLPNSHSSLGPASLVIMSSEKSFNLLSWCELMGPAASLVPSPGLSVSQTALSGVLHAGSRFSFMIVSREARMTLSPGKK